jgi:hypothetical protein
LRTLGETVPQASLWAVENAGGLGRYLAQRLAAAGDAEAREEEHSTERGSYTTP